MPVNSARVLSRRVPAGQRNHLVTILNPPTRTDDHDGGYTEDATWLTRVWAAITPATAANLERVVSGTVESTASHLVVMPYRADVTTQTRLLFANRTLAVTSVQNPDEANAQLVLVCSEVVP